MSDNERTDNPPVEDEDAGLRDALARRSETTSDSHDSAVLLAAQDAGRDIRGRRGGTETTSAGWMRWARPAAVAAVLVVGFYIVFDTSIAPPTVPDTTVRGIGAEEVTPVHRSTLSELPERFQWPAQAGATGYRVVLRDANASPVWSTDSLTENSIALPGDLDDQLTAGATYLWTVEIEGASIESDLGPFWFRVAE